MHYVPDTRIPVEESVPLATVAGSGGEEVNESCSGNNTAGQESVFCCGDTHYRRLAKGSIICGVSCIGICALINSIEAEKASNPVDSARFSRQAKKLSIIAIVTLFASIAVVFGLMILVSYLLTLRD